MTYTANPELDAALHDDEIEAADEFQQKAEIEAPKLVMKDLQSIKKPRDWWATALFHGGNSAEDLLRDGMSVDDDIADAYSEFITAPTQEAKEKMLMAMAAWFGKLHALEIYTDWLEDLK